MFMPTPIDVDGQTITMYDPVSHVVIGAVNQRRRSFSVVANASTDRRWERIARPVVVVGGELTLEMLDLTFNPIARFYEAPIQMKANGGVFVVDDFGRQRIPGARPVEPLDRPAREPRRLPDAAHREEV